MLIPLALIAVGVLWPVLFRPGSDAADISDPVVFSNYDVDLIVSAGGRLDAVETITAEFPSGRHGLFKYWAVDNQKIGRASCRERVWVSVGGVAWKVKI